jgi:hypothetical protein
VNTPERAIGGRRSRAGWAGAALEGRSGARRAEGAVSTNTLLANPVWIKDCVPADQR